MLDLTALKQKQDDLSSRTSSNSNLFFPASKITDDTTIRILPPHQNMKGVYFVEQIGYWINKKYYISPSTFGKDCPISEEVDKAKNSKNKDAIALLESRDFMKKSTFIVPILLIEQQGEKQVVVDDSYKLLQCGTMLIKAINKVVTHREYQNGTEDGICDRSQGYNIYLSKSGKGLDTEYSAQGAVKSSVMLEKYYTQLPDCVTMTQKMIKSNDYLRSIIRNYLYGEAIIEEAIDNTTEVASNNMQVKETPKQTNVVEKSIVEKQTESKQRSILDDLEMLDD